MIKKISFLIIQVGIVSHTKEIINILASSAISYRLIEVNNDTQFLNLQKISNSSTFPQIFINNQYIGGYNEFITLYRNGKLNSIK